MLYRCDIKRPGASSTDGYNQPVPGAFASHLTAEPCTFSRLAEGAEGEQVNDANSVIFDQYELRIRLTADVTERDQVSEVRNDGGTAIGGPYAILHVVRALTHLQLVVERIR